jgi:hypothetical protein
LQPISAPGSESVREKAAGTQGLLQAGEIALVLVRFYHVASFIVNANHSVM